MTENIEKPSYYAIITADVRYSEKLNPSEKLLYAEITSLINKYGYCWASNEYLSSLFNVSDRSITRWIEALNKNGFVKLEYEFKGTQITKRKIFPLTKMSVAEDKIVCGTADKNGGDITIKVFNNLNKDKHMLFDTIIQDYNSICGNDLPKVSMLNEKRIKSINSLQKSIKDVDFKMLFEKAAESDFLSGRSTKWKCNFDWLMNSTNALKVIEGNYSNSAGGNNANDKQLYVKGEGRPVIKDRDNKTASQLAEEHIRSFTKPIEEITTIF